jgi:ankyrin repeat protein
MIAVFHNEPLMVKTLLDAGADATVADWDERTALTIA